MKNDYRIEDDMVYIVLRRRSNPNIETVVDLEDFNKVLKLLDVRWYANQDRAGSFYVKANIKDGKNILLHRTIYGETLEDNVIDHMNRDTLDNTRKNLREVSRKSNNQNRRVRHDSMSKVRGVTKRKDKYQVRISHEGKRKHIGYFDTLEEAEEAALQALRRYQPDSLV